MRRIARTPLILSMALVCVAGGMAGELSFRAQEIPDSPTVGCAVRLVEMSAAGRPTKNVHIYWNETSGAKKRPRKSGSAAVVPSAHVPPKAISVSPAPDGARILE